MKITPIKTRKILSSEQDIYSVLDEALETLPERSILAITSKIVAISEGRVIPKDSADKDKLVKEEADLYLPKDEGADFMLTIKSGILMPSAGIDESNSKNFLTLWPSDPQASANSIYDYLRDKFQLKEFGVIITDSRLLPLRWGTTGVTIAYCGFNPLKDYIGKPDIFGKPLKHTKANVSDALAAAAVLIMGEGSEQTPLAMLEDLDFVEFTQRHPTQEELNDLKISLDEDIYSRILRNADWQKN